MKKYGWLLLLWFLSMMLFMTTSRHTSHAQPQQNDRPLPERIMAVRVNSDKTADALTPKGMPLPVVERHLPPGTLIVPNEPYKHMVDDYPLSWQYYFSAEFNDLLPLPDSPTTAFPCQRFDQVPRANPAYWGKAKYPDGSSEMDFSLWAARDGSGGVDPQVSPFPVPMDSWLVCGPFDVTEATDFQVRYRLAYYDRSATAITFMGISWNGEDFFGTEPVNITDWTNHHTSFAGVEEQTTVWVAWQFQASAGTYTQGNNTGAWLDDLQVWAYFPPGETCGEADFGNKGLVVPANDPTAPAGGFTPIIRHGDMKALYQVYVSDARWARLEFIQEGGDDIDYLDYDLIVDSLCFYGISVLGLVDHQTLERQDANELASALEYRLEFAQQVGEIASHFAGRITYWEVWNEENDPGGAEVFAVFYAPLLLESYESIKTVNPNAQVLFGGLASAWGDSNQYLVDVYRNWNDYWGGVRPFDYLAIHPYPNDINGLNPVDYMYKVVEPDENTILDKFSRTMAFYEDFTKTIWITEVGWNAAKEAITPPPPPCLVGVQVTETEQASYLKPAFDILFTEAYLWDHPEIPAVNKVFWYQYMDSGIKTPCDPPFPQEETVAWLWGLYDSDKKNIKFVWCAYWAYPLTCSERLTSTVYLPVTAWHVVVSQPEP